MQAKARMDSLQRRIQDNPTHTYFCAEEIVEVQNYMVIFVGRRRAFSGRSPGFSGGIWEIRIPNFWLRVVRGESKLYP